VPREFGGLGLDVTQVSRLCEVLGHYCASTAMVFAMHQIQVACIVHHALGTAFFRDYVRELASRQLLIASATTELGIGGDVRQSICAVKTVESHFILEKQAPVISYGEEADAILVTAGGPDVPPPLVEQLAPGGRLLIPLGVRGAQTLTLVERGEAAGQLRHTPLGTARFVPLLGEHGFDA